MTTKSGTFRLFLFFTGTFVYILTCSTPSQPPEKPRLAPVADMSMFVNDTARLCAEPVFAPATIKGFLWSFDGGKSYPETTTVACIDRCWGLADTGIHVLAVKIFDTKKAYRTRSPSGFRSSYAGRTWPLSPTPSPTLRTQARFT